MINIIYSPMEQFNIYSIIPSFFGLEINNVVLIMLVALTFAISLLWVGISRNQVSLNNWGVITETMYHSNLNLVSSYIGMNNRVYFPLLYTIFYFIFFSNVLGLFPYSTTSTVELVITLCISSTMLLGILVIGYQNLNTKLFAMLIPEGTPLGLVFLLVFLEFMAYFTKILSLGLRLAINMITGHILAKVCIGFIWSGYLSSKGIFVLIPLLPLLLLTGFLALEILIAYLQAYIFVFILCLTFKDVVQL